MANIEHISRDILYNNSLNTYHICIENYANMIVSMESAPLVCHDVKHHGIGGTHGIGTDGSEVMY